MRELRFLKALVAVGMLGVVGCSTTVRYSPDVVAERVQRIGVPMPGKVLVYTTAEQDAYVYSGRPKSFAGGAVKAKIPFGQMAREIALRTFEVAFREGAVAAHSMRNVAGYQVIVMPQVTHFEYLYKPLPGSILYTVAELQMRLRVKVISSRAEVLVDRVYDSNRVLSDPTAGYVPKVLHKAAHTVLCDLMGDAVRDVKLALLQQSMVAPAPQPRPVAPVAPVYTPQPVYQPPPDDMPEPVMVD